MDPYPRPLRDLILQLKRLPGIGEKTATRLALSILADEGDLAGALALSLKRVKEQIRLCPVCFNLTDADRCAICSNPHRDAGIICVVEDPSDIMALETSHEFSGVYHVLHGLISPLSGIGPGDIRLAELLRRLGGGAVREVIVATNPSVEGEGTAHYVRKAIRDAGIDVRLSRIASGVPMGGELKYMDQVTLASAFRYRRGMNEE